MTRSSSAEPAKGTKRKGKQPPPPPSFFIRPAPESSSPRADHDRIMMVWSKTDSNNSSGTRSVSTLNPAQLARKRANDREAQRAIRARTKEHIERLEQQLADLQSERGGDQSQTIQELTRRNRALEEEIYRLREAAGQPTGHSYPNSVYDDNLSSVSGAIPSPRSSPFPASGGYSGMPELGPSYVPLPDASESWGPGVSVPSNVSSPSSSANTDEYGGAYIPTSIPAPMMEARSVPAKMDYDDVDSDAGYPLSHHRSQVGANGYLPHEPWNMYPALYYQQQPSAH
ncbi:hypothetical protein VD0002_g10119 [Verticillium dahliae]|uniref:BZIP domain-containing protein n=2 Tax=Verticillium TaxID=1036719 RepID=A0AA44WR68_VERDA|nr:hypothetical protein BJF96_g1537 [Verticillium dahliae]PNH37643.1 hypothetical protein VD0004_g9154 [Verticillium dahliae]PNH40009.1 hypothetical protein VD0003_g10138 [Verticillium dahliae]PNH53058.1 hypothetical protein VD0002_g10119 [Verticillium dahliae]PNH72442.1 hypothetical protein VD0001_g5125 [Verticillium dahliae]